jgi:hypothetical protein
VKTGSAKPSRPRTAPGGHSRTAARQSGVAAVEERVDAATLDSYSLLTNERARIAAHEAGHSVACFLLRGRVGPCSIEETKRWAGVAFVGTRRVSPRAAATLTEKDAPIPPMLAATVRSYFEHQALIALCGPAAEKLYFDRFLPIAAPRPRLLPTVVERGVALRPAERAYLAAGNDADAPLPPGDEEIAVRALSALDLRQPDLLRRQFDDWAVRLAESFEFGRLVDLLAPLLLEHETLGGKAVRDTLTRRTP